MKFLKVLILAALLPLTAFGQRTNIQDNLSLQSSFRLVPGAAAGRVIISDVFGVGTWQVPVTGGDVFLARTNVFTSTNFFQGPVRIGTNTLVTTAVPFEVLTTNRMVAAFYSTAPSAESWISVGNGSTTGSIFTASSVGGFRLEKASMDFAVQAFNGSTFFTVNSPSGLTRMFFNGQVDGNWTQGDSSADTATWNNSTTAIPNNQNIGSGALYISNAWGAGVNATTLDNNRFRVNIPTTSIPSADALISASLSNRIALAVQGQPGQVSNIVDITSSTGTALFQFSSVGRFVNTSAGNTVVSPTAGSTFGGTAINGINLIIFSTASSTNLLINTAVGQTTPFLIIESTNGTSFVQIQENSIRFGTNGTPFSASIADSFTFDAPSIAAQSTFYTNVTMSGLAAGAATLCGTDTLTSNIVYSAHATAPNQATISMFNGTILPIDPANQTIRVRSIQP